jgi:hypothetical protein
VSDFSPPAFPQDPERLDPRIYGAHDVVEIEHGPGIGGVLRVLQP